MCIEAKIKSHLLNLCMNFDPLPTLTSGELISDLFGLEDLKNLAISLQMHSLVAQINDLQSRLSPETNVTDGSYLTEDFISGDGDINNVSFITLSGLETLVEGELVVGEEEVTDTGRQSG